MDSSEPALQTRNLSYNVRVSDRGEETMQRNVTALAVASACLMFSALQARAAGFALHEKGSGGRGTAVPGRAVAAQDAPTGGWTPAGMARLAPGKHFSLGGAYIAP